jgi:hypothetical protein
VQHGCHEVLAVMEGCVQRAGHVRGRKHQEQIGRRRMQLERTAPEQYKFEPPLGARAPPLQSSLL